jgi:hypothetical protein
VQRPRHFIEGIAGAADVVNGVFHGLSNHQRYTLLTKPFG